MPTARNFESILIHVGADLVGDGLVKLPFVMALREAFPDARITWLAGKGKTVYAGVLKHMSAPYIDETIEDIGIGHDWSEVFDRTPLLDGRRFDLVIDTQRRLRTTLAVRRIRHGTFVSPAARFLASDLKPRNPFRRRSRVLVRELLDIAELVAGRTFETPPKLDVPVTEAMRADAERLLPAGPVYVGLAPGAGGAHKCWPRESFVEIARRAVRRDQVPVFLLGPQEEDWRDDLAQQVPAALFPLQDAEMQARYGYEPLWTVAVGERLTATLCNDSGTSHMLAAAGIPIIALYGIAMPAKFRPLTPRLHQICAVDFGGEAAQDIPVDPVDAALSAVLAG